MHTIPDYTLRQRRQFIRSLAAYLRHQISHSLLGDWVLTFTFRASGPSFGTSPLLHPPMKRLLPLICDILGALLCIASLVAIWIFASL